VFSCIGVQYEGSNNGVKLFTVIKVPKSLVLEKMIGFRSWSDVSIKGFVKIARIGIMTIPDGQKTIRTVL
jgi:hypothetical protein